MRDFRLDMQDDSLEHLPRLLSTPASHSSLNVHAKQLTLQLLVFDWVTEQMYNDQLLTERHFWKGIQTRKRLTSVQRQVNKNNSLRKSQLKDVS